MASTIKTVLTLFLLILSQKVFPQDWIRLYGIGQKASSRCVISDYDNGYLFSGVVNDYKYVWVIKTDINGNIIWNKKFGNGSYNCGNPKIQKTIDGGSIISGGWQKNNLFWDSFIIKLNACGEIEWCNTLDTPDIYDFGSKVLPTPEGDFVLMSYFVNENPPSNTSLFKFNSSGNLIWHQYYPLDSVYYQDEISDLLVDDDGYLVTASRYAPDSGTLWPKVMRSYFMKTDTAGMKQWDLIYGLNNHYYTMPWTTIKSSSGNYIHSCTHSAGNTENPALIFLDRNGTSARDKDLLIGNSNFCGFGYFSELADTNLVLFGGLWDNSNIWTDYAMKTDTAGNLRKLQPLTSTSNSFLASTKTFDNKFVAVALDSQGTDYWIVAIKVNSDLEYDSIYTQPFTYDSLCPYPIVSDTIDPNCNNVLVSVDEPFKKPETTQLKVYPNPTDNILTVELPKYLVVTDNSSNVPATTIYHQWSSALLQAIDLQGKTVLQQEVANTGELIQLDVSKLPAGMYQFRLLYHGRQAAGSKVVVK